MISIFKIESKLIKNNKDILSTHKVINLLNIMLMCGFLFIFDACFCVQRAAEQSNSVCVCGFPT